MMATAIFKNLHRDETGIRSRKYREEDYLLLLTFSTAGPAVDWGLTKHTSGSCFATRRKQAGVSLGARMMRRIPLPDANNNYNAMNMSRHGSVRV